MRLACPDRCYPQTQLMVETPTASTMRLDGGHPALDLVNTIYGQVGGPVEHDVLATPQDLVTFARRVGVASENTSASADALRAAVALRGALDPLLRGHDRASAERGFEAAARAAQNAAHLVPRYAWAWDDDDPLAPVHRLTHAAAGLLTNEAELARLHCCEGCCWLFLDHSRGAGRRWCSMADCGTEAKKRRYVERRRAARMGA